MSQISTAAAAAIAVGLIAAAAWLSGRPARSGFGARARPLWSSSDIDPIVTGQLYSAGHPRHVYTQRTAFGLREFKTDGGPGAVGVDIGPFGLAEYGGRQSARDDGIPENWAFPSTPFRMYEPANEDYYSFDGPKINRDAVAAGVYPLFEPDHQPQMP